MMMTNISCKTGTPHDIDWLPKANCEVALLGTNAD